jgi:hypothetical protein
MELKLVGERRDYNMSATAKRKYTLSDLHVGMVVRESEISNILDTYFVIINSKIVNETDIEGELVYIGNGKDVNYKKWFEQDNPITPLYFISEDAVIYDELEKSRESARKYGTLSTEEVRKYFANKRKN